MAGKKLSGNKVLFQNIAYRRLMLGQTISVLGASITTYALFAYTYSVTNSANSASLIASLHIVANLMVSIPVGKKIDQGFPLRWMLGSVILAIVAFVPALATYLLLGVIPFAGLCWLAFVLGVSNAIYGPSERAFLKTLVPPELLGTAMAINQTRYSMGTVLGPVLGALIYSFNKVATFVVDLLTYLVVLPIIASLKTHDPEADSPTQQSTTPDEEDNSYQKAISFIRSKPLLTAIVWYAPCLNLSLAGVLNTSSLTLISSPGGYAQLAIFQSVYGIAGFLGATSATYLVGKVAGGKILVWTTIAFGSLFASATVYHSFLALIIIFILCGMVLPVFNSVLSGYFIFATPSRMVGKASAIMSVTAMISMPVGTWFSGILFTHYSPTVSYIVFASMFMVATAAFLRIDSVRKLPAPDTWK